MPKGSEEPSYTRKYEITFSEVKNCQVHNSGKVCMKEKIMQFIKGDIVLTVSFCLAVCSCVLVPPSSRYLDYIDFRTLILLFCLMLIIGGLRELNFFQFVGNWILDHAKTRRGIVATLVFLCFFSSMFITNDVALITFVPFGIMILRSAGMAFNTCQVVVLMTIAANLGSMFTPIGNPQNLYLFSLSGFTIGEFLLLMLPYTAVSAILLLLFVLIGGYKKKFTICIEAPEVSRKGVIGCYLFLFLFCLFTVGGILPPWILLVLVSLGILLTDRRLFLKIDYSLLLTFFFLFIFVGNINEFETLRQMILAVFTGHERLVAIGTSQIISNVPAAMLLSGYTDNIKALIVGTNIGGLGTLIASMASLISYRQIASVYPDFRKRYLLAFTFYNLIFLAVLCLI